MIKLYLLCIAVIFTVLSSTVWSTPDETCKTKSNTDCKACLGISGCAYCKNSKECFAFDPISSKAPCSASDMQAQTCFANAQTLLIILGSVGGVVLIAVIVIICCLCKRYKRCTLRKEQKRQDLDNQRMEERRAGAEIRTSERNEMYDKYRMKYGLLKDKDNGTDYKRLG